MNLSPLKTWRPSWSQCTLFLVAVLSALVVHGPMKAFWVEVLLGALAITIVFDVINIYRQTPRITDDE